MAVIKCLSSDSEAMSLSQVIEYAKNPEKTSLADEKMLEYISNEAKAALVTGLNCDPELAVDQFRATKKLWKKNEGVQVHHVIQSFSPDDPLTPEEAHEIGVKLAERIAPGFEIVVATHIDKQHLHNHIVINSVSFETGKKYHSSKGHLYKIREISNELCAEKGLAVLPDKAENDRLTMEEVQLQKKGIIPWKDDLRGWIRNALSSSRSKDEFISFLNEKGVKVKWQNKNVSFLHPSKEKFIRGKTLGAEFEIDNLAASLSGEKKKKLDSLVTNKNAVKKEESNSLIRNVLLSYKREARQADLVNYLTQQGYELHEHNSQPGSFRVKDFPGLIVTGNRWYSYSLKTGGNSIDFCMRFENSDYLESVSKLIGIPIDELDKVQIPVNQGTTQILNDVSSYLNSNILNVLLKENKLYENDGKLIFLHQNSNGFTSYTPSSRKWNVESAQNNPTAFTLAGHTQKLIVCSNPFSCLRISKLYDSDALPHFIESRNSDAILAYVKEMDIDTVVWPRPSNEKEVQFYDKTTNDLKAYGVAVLEVDKPKGDIHTRPHFGSLPGISTSLLQRLIHDNLLYFTEDGVAVFNAEKSAYMDNQWSYGSDVIDGWSLPGGSGASTLVVTNAPDKLLYSLDRLQRKGVDINDVHGLSAPSFLHPEAINRYLRDHPEIKHIVLHAPLHERHQLEWMELSKELEQRGIDVERITYKQPGQWDSVLDAALYGLEMNVYEEADAEKQRSLKKLLNKKGKQGRNQSNKSR
ncbi:relaxase/mobilization nuclease domain-containing protein [Brevibacillus centrosporus]|uniref:relaxase/mobilization nuclease domain-containing protein n=1 Tax=Brevibacillus centrosporus TaxID=54910 RepID=UPI003D1CD0BB